MNRFGTVLESFIYSNIAQNDFIFFSNDFEIAETFWNCFEIIFHFF